MEPSRTSLLAIYLNDHLAGASAGTSLLNRAAREHHGEPVGRELGELAREVAEDRRSLMGIMRDLDLPVDRLRMHLGRLAELAGRFKPNGRLVGRSPLSDLLEMEAMRLGVEGKAAAWRTLRDLSRDEPRLNSDLLHHLLRRADQQIETLERLRTQAVTGVWRPTEHV